MDRNTTREMLSTIRDIQEGIISEGSENGQSFPITKTTPQFGDVRVSQEQSLIKTVGESVELNDKSLVYYPEKKDLVFSGKITSLNLTFQFRFNDPSGDGCYIWAEALQLTETNNRTIGKLRDAFVNWKSALIQDGDLFDKLEKAIKRN